MIAYWSAFIFVLLAEMGDKTQLLAIALASKFNWKTVMLGIAAATALNHLLAVLVGSWLTSIIPLSWISIAASVSFIIFGLWTLRGDKLDEKSEEKENLQRPFRTVAVTFFLAEMGDKTQLATVALAAQFQSIIPVWLGTFSGMIIADGAGVLLGSVMGKKLPEKAIQWFAAIVFIASGIWGLYESVPC